MEIEVNDVPDYGSRRNLKDILKDLYQYKYEINFLQSRLELNERILRKILRLLPLDGEYALDDEEKHYAEELKSNVRTYVN